MTRLSPCIVAFIISLILCTADARKLSAGGGTTRKYFIAANTVTWDYAPLGINQCQGRAFSPAEELVTIRGLGLKYKKAQYQAYTDATFTKRLERSADEEHLALLGPLLRAEVGDRVVVTLKNNLDFTINFDPAGLLGTQVVYNLLTLPNRTEIYDFSVPDEAGPTSTQPSSILWLYRSTAEGNEAAHQNAGLYGPIVVARRGSADETGKTKDATREIVSVFFINDENKSPFYDENLARHSGIKKDALPAEELTEANQKHAINGRQFCNLEGLNGKTGEKIRWYSAALGNEADVHNVHWHGVVVEKDNAIMDQFSLLTSDTATADLIADNPGVWLFHCHVNKHLDGGMVSLFNLTGPSTGLQNFKSVGSLRTYYVQAQEEVWDVAPSGGNQCSGKRENFTSVEAVYMANQPDRIGRKPIKARFVEYTDGNFTTPKVRTAAEIHLGILGPIIRAEVGDTIHVVFRNKVRFPSSMHPHGVLYDKASEGAPYNDGTTGADKADDLVLTNQTHTYVWHVPERSGPGPGEKSSKIWMYHSHSHETADTFAGLMGAIIISRRGSSRPDGTLLDVDREFVLFWMVTDESKSSLFNTNLNAYLSKKYIGKGLPQVRSMDSTRAASNTRGGNQTAPLKQPTNEGVAGANKALLKLLRDPDFEESNLKHGINGLLYCNLPGLEAREGQRIRIYHMALGSEVDLHTPGIRLTSQDWSSNSVSVVSLLAGDMQTADAQLTTPGASVLQCNVADHITAGMRALFYVQPQNNSAFDAALSQVDARSHQSAPMTASRGQNQNMTAALSHSDATSKSAMVITKATAGSLSIPLMDFVYGFEARIRKGLAALGITSPPLQAVAKVASADKPLRQAVTRTYFIQAEQQEWDYAPSKMNRCTGKDFEDKELLYTTKTNETLGPLVMKGVYRAYSDGSFSEPSPHPKELGILGPLIRVQVGDTLKVVFRNSLHFAVNLVFDGGLIPDDRAVATAPVQPNTTVTITYSVPSTAGPGAKDASTVHYVYRSDVDIVSHAYAGLVGVIMVAQQGTLTPSGGLPGIDVVVPLLFQVWDESRSPYFETNIKKYNPTVDQEADNFVEGNLKHSINGLVYCNIPDVKLKTGDRVRWLLTGLGTENDMHSPFFTNQVLEFNHAHVASVELYPAMTRTADMIASAPGIFGFRCDVVDHIAAGMKGRMVISQ